MPCQPALCAPRSSSACSWANAMSTETSNRINVLCPHCFAATPATTTTESAISGCRPHDTYLKKQPPCRRGQHDAGLRPQGGRGSTQQRHRAPWFSRSNSVPSQLLSFVINSSGSNPNLSRSTRGLPAARVAGRAFSMPVSGHLRASGVFGSFCIYNSCRAFIRLKVKECCPRQARQFANPNTLIAALHCRHQNRPV